MDGVNGWHQIYVNDLKPIVEETFDIEAELLIGYEGDGLLDVFKSIFKKTDFEGGVNNLERLLSKLEGYDFYKSYPNVHKDALDGLSEFLFLHTEYTKALTHTIRNLSNKAKGMEYSASAYRVDLRELDLAKNKNQEYHDQMILKLTNMS
tara:strand:+ start:263 stop:712 length:450 start_codon:yes stop_codon:yes gene_type:complete